MTMSDTKAIEDQALATFRNPHNCAQTVAAALGDKDQVPALAACGGGRAPDGRCGALHAALLHVPAGKRAAIEAAFVKTTGAATCREIKNEFRTPCETCVRTAAMLAAR